MAGDNATPANIDIIIVNRDTADHLHALLTRLIATRADRPYHVTVVDNDSRDGSQNIVRRYPEVRLIANSTNSTYARSCNQGAAAVHAERGPGGMLLFLNADVDIDGRCIEQLAEGMGPGIGAVVPLVWTYDPIHRFMSSCLKPPTPWLCLHENTVLSHFPAGAGLRGYQACDRRLWNNLDEPVEVPATPGSILMVRRDMFHRLKGWDERFTSGHDDVDLCVRIRRDGHRIVRVPGTAATHFFAQARKRPARTDDPALASWHDPRRDPVAYITKYYGRRTGDGVRRIMRIEDRIKTWRRLAHTPLNRVPAAGPRTGGGMTLHWPDQDDREWFLELSLSRAFMVSMARRVQGTSTVLAPDLLARLLPRKHYWRVIPAAHTAPACAHGVFTPTPEIA
ncbi:glycosyltransferase [bacterium]|nr:glycosyltransferase [candidate division CSSED10-310 bacterium]